MVSPIEDKMKVSLILSFFSVIVGTAGNTLVRIRRDLISWNRRMNTLRKYDALRYKKSYQIEDEHLHLIRVKHHLRRKSKVDQNQRYRFSLIF